MNASFYNEIKKILISARNKVYQTANFAMVEAYWNIGKSIIEGQGGNEKAEQQCICGKRDARAVLVLYKYCLYICGSTEIIQRLHCLER